MAVLVPQKHELIKQRQSGSYICGKAWTAHPYLLTGVAVFFALWAPRLTPAQENVQKQDVTVTLSNGDIVRGKLVHLDDENVTVSDTSKTPIATSTLKIPSVRKITAPARSTNSNELMIGLVNGSYVRADTISTDDSTAFLSIGDRILEVPRDTVHWIAFKESQSGSPDTYKWLAELPENPAADIIAIKRDTAWQFIECAITQITPENVVVLLDGESIPVKRSKIFGICWLHPGETPGKAIEPNSLDILLRSPQVEMKCRKITWNEDLLCWEVTMTSIKDDFVITLPADALSSIDYTFGRHIDLTRRPPANSRTDPYFGGLAGDATLLQYFSPRIIMTPDDEDQDASVPALLIHPRTEITWTVPDDSRRFQASFSLAKNSVSPTAVVIQIDNSEVFQTVLGNPEEGDMSNQPLSVDIPLNGGKQLKIIVDFLKKPLNGTDEKTMVSLLSGPIQVKNPRIER